MTNHNPDQHQTQARQRSEADTQADQLVTVESQRELDLFTGERIERTFVKLYVEARRSGLLAAISDRDWKTLCTLATYMDGEGYCYPSQIELAKAMGCSRQMANERVKSLAQFRFRDQAVLLVVKGERTDQGTWARNGYRILPLSSLRIYDQSFSPEEQTPARTDEAGAVSTVSSFLDTVHRPEATVSSHTGPVPLDTKKNHTLEQDENTSNIRRVSPTVDNSKPGAQGRLSGQQRRTQEAESIGTVVERVPLGEASARWQRQHLAKDQHASKPQPDTDVPVVRSRARRMTTPRRRGRPRVVRAQDEAYQVLQHYMEDFARELNDQAPLKSSTTRLYNLFTRSGLDLDTFIAQLYAARAIVKERTAGIRSGSDDHQGTAVKRKAGYYFAVLEDLLGLKEGDDEDHSPGRSTP